nr:pentatricopeptide repeat-containing protein At1g08070, chloroplastic isoform X1 [Solanum lycopersicum]XP_025886912.1 pentatricopeptide repeat-containing protein At1g08070, chloroplastic isoform X1 [Solanum lycopersicum]XP_025886913.1 pentatricopeptide repeat-containing protein At1g08070, chloroplastic isoform X1 [Solanum lycopersicum]
MALIFGCTVNSQDPSVFPKLHTSKSIKKFNYLITKTSSLQHTQQPLYAKIIFLCSSSIPSKDMSYIHSLFTQIYEPDIDVYNSIMRCVLSTKCKENALLGFVMYVEMMCKGLDLDKYTYPLVIKACVELRELRYGRLVHAHVIKNGFALDLYVVNNLMRLYGVCGCVGSVRKVFDRSPVRDLVSWTILIQGYVDNGYWKEGVDLFFEMVDDGLRADERMMVVVISACAKLGDSRLGKKLHKYVQSHKLNFDVFLGNALVDMYLKCGERDVALDVFREMPMRNVISWNTVISGLAQRREFKQALSAFIEMQDQGVKPDENTLVGVLNCCSSLGALEVGKWVHRYIDRNRIQLAGFVGNALVDLYAKCGSMDDALRVFGSMATKDVYSYTSVIVGLATHGKARMALKFFYEMLDIGIKPNEVTFVGVLTACSHGGLVEEGHNFFTDMWRVHKLKPRIEHYGCMVDLLGRAGLIDEAMEFVKHMPIEPDASIWGSILAACRIQGKVELAEHVTEILVNMESEKDGTYTLMSNTYASVSKWKDALEVRKAMKRQKIKKVPGCSSIELDGVVSEFRRCDKAHPRSKDIYAMVEQLTFHLIGTEADGSESCII